LTFNNAGLLGPQMRIHEMSQAQWDKTFAVNVTSIFYGLKTTIPHMLKQMAGNGCSRGKIVNIASNGGSYGVPLSPAYSAAKGAVLNLTRQIAIDYGKDGINANSISPGIIKTPLSAGILSNPVISAQFLSKTPWPRFGEPSDVGAAAVFLASEGADYCHGMDLVIDGGYLST